MRPGCGKAPSDAMPSHQDAFPHPGRNEAQEQALGLHIAIHENRLPFPWTRLLFDLRTAGFDTDLLHYVTQSTASWVEYAHLAVTVF